MVILFISVMLVYLVLSIMEDYGYIESKSLFWHVADAWSRGILVAYIALLQFKSFWVIVAICLVFNSSWWILFDFGINIARDHSLFYVGSSGIDLAFKDLCRKKNWGLINTMMSCKLILLTLSTAFLFIALNYL